MNAIDRVTMAKSRDLGLYCSSLDTILSLPVLTAFTETVDPLPSATKLQPWPRKLVSLVEELHGGCASDVQPPAHDLCLQFRAAFPELFITSCAHYESQIAFLRCDPPRGETTTFLNRIRHSSHCNKASPANETPIYKLTSFNRITPISRSCWSLQEREPELNRGCGCQSLMPCWIA